MTTRGGRREFGHIAFPFGSLSTVPAEDTLDRRGLHTIIQEVLYDNSSSQYESMLIHGPGQVVLATL
jgi:hypothetical protein